MTYSVIRALIFPIEVGIVPVNLLFCNVLYNIIKFIIYNSNNIQI